MEDDEEELIISAAWRVLERSHFRTLKVRQVLAASGVSSNGFYRRFPSKSHLLVALCEDEMGRVVSELERVLAADEDPSAQLRAWIELHVDIGFDERRADRARMFLDPVLVEEQPHEVERIHRATTRPLASILSRGAEMGVFDVSDPEVQARAIYYMILGFTEDTLAGVLDLPRDRVVEAILRIASRALSPVRGPALN